MTQYSADTPWLCWDRWSKFQTYRSPNPPWYREPTSIWTDPKRRAVWEPHGDAGIALIWRLTHHLASRSRIGVVWGDPVALQRELGTEGPVDLSWLIEAGWCRYITDDEKDRRERDVGAKDDSAAPQKKSRAPRRKPVVGANNHSPTLSKKPPANAARERVAEAQLLRNPDMKARALADQLHCTVRTIYNLAAWRKLRPRKCERKLPVPEERRGEERKAEDSHSDSASVREPTARNQSIRVSPKAQQSKTEPKAEPEAKQRPKAQPGPQEPAGSPNNPKEPEVGGRQPKSPRRRTAAPRASSGRRRGDAVPLGACLPRLHWDDPAAVDFGRRVVETLWPGRDMGTEDANSEVGCFAKFYIEQRARSPTGVGNGFVDDCLAKARHIARYGKSAQRPGAVLRALLRKKYGATSQVQGGCCLR